MSTRGFNDYTFASKNRMNASKAKKEASKIKIQICVIVQIHLFFLSI